MIERTDAIVLRSMKYRETSKIVTLYTRSFGKISVLAKGARQTKSKFGGALEPMSHIEVVLYKKAHRELHLLSNASIIHLNRELHRDFNRLTIGYAVIELLNTVMHDEEENEHVFTLSEHVLEELDSGTKNFLNLLFYYEIKLATLLGFGLIFDRCCKCGLPIEEGKIEVFGFRSQEGGLLHDGCGGSDNRWLQLSLTSVCILQKIKSTSLHGSMNVEIPLPSRREIDSLLSSHYASHIEQTQHQESRGMVRSIFLS